MLLPPIQVHSTEEVSNSQTSLRYPCEPPASRPSPPKSQRWPLLSVQLAAVRRLPGRFPAAGVPKVPYTPPGRAHRPFLQFDVLIPPIQVQLLGAGCADATAANRPRARIARRWMEFLAAMRKLLECFALHGKPSPALP